MKSACVSSAVPLDHVILYGGFEMDELFDFFERAGFYLTPLGRHSLGTVNRLAMLDTQYIELIGFLPGTPPTVRPEVQSLPLGLNSIAAAENPEHRRVRREGLAEPMALERLVDTPQAHGTARFTITHAQSPATDARAFLCRHHTPDLLWVADWMGHRNGAFSIAEVRIPTREPEHFAAVVDSVFDVPAEHGRTCWSSAGSTVRIIPATTPGTLTVLVRDIEAARRTVLEAGLAYSEPDGALHIPLPSSYRSELVLKGP